MDWLINNNVIISFVIAILGIGYSIYVATNSTKQLNFTKKELQTEIIKLQKLSEEIKERENILLDITSKLSKNIDGPQFIQLSNDSYKVVNNQSELVGTINVKLKQ